MAGMSSIDCWTRPQVSWVVKLGRARNITARMNFNRVNPSCAQKFLSCTQGVREPAEGNTLLWSPIIPFDRRLRE